MVSTEPAYADFAAGLRDIHVEVGHGVGWTWRPNRLEAWPVAWLRLDHIFLGPGVEARTTGVDCSLVGDHCIVTGEIVVP